MKIVIAFAACISTLLGQDFNDGRQKTSSSAPAVIHRVEAEYTTAARRKGLQGVIALGARIGADGIPTEIRVLKPLDPGLDEKAIEALKQWRFRPAEVNGKAVATEARIEFEFHPPQFPVLTDPAMKAEEEPVQDTDPVFPFWW